MELDKRLTECEGGEIIYHSANTSIFTLYIDLVAIIELTKPCTHADTQAYTSIIAFIDVAQHLYSKRSVSAKPAISFGRFIHYFMYWFIITNHKITNSVIKNTYDWSVEWYGASYYQLHRGLPRHTLWYTGLRTCTP